MEGHVDVESPLLDFLFLYNSNADFSFYEELI